MRAGVEQNQKTAAAKVLRKGAHEDQQEYDQPYQGGEHPSAS